MNRSRPAPSMPATEGAPITPLRETWRQLMSGAGRYRDQLRASLIGVAIAAACQGLGLACIVPVFQALAGERRFDDAVGWLAVMTALMLVATVLRWRAMGFDFRGDMVETTHALRTRLGEQLRRMPLQVLQDRRSGEFNATLLGNVDENLSYTMTVANLMALALLTPLAAALAILILDWRMGLVLLLVLPLLIPLYRWRRPAFGRSMRDKDEAHRLTSAEILEFTQGLPVLRASRCAGERSARLQAGFRRLETLQAIDQREGSQPNLVLATVMEGAILMVVCVGAVLVVRGRLDVATLAALLVLVVRFAEPLATFVIYTKVIDLIEAALARIADLLAIRPLPIATPSRRPTRFDIRFEAVRFRYASATEPTLRAFSASLPARSLTALVGPSGAGKTTITRLLQRQADPEAGVITIGDVDVRSIATDDLDALISVVFQDVYLFDDSILANIRMARPDASDQEVRAAARAAHCHDFIERLPEGYLTRVGDIGGRLSGGERQRISIARAMLKDAPIVVLDEPTAALDTESERAVQAAIDRLVRDRTVIVIAHRLSTIAGADRILVIDAGGLAEQGRHDELLRAGGRYARMWQAQEAVKHWHVRA